MSQITKLFNELKANRENDGAAVISTVDTAKLIRARLKAEFPGTKFSVRKDGHNCVRIYWEHGPTSDEVNAITGEYKFGGFDGMIDLAYSGKNWLLPDGSMKPACSDGTVGSAGVVPAFQTDAPHPQAILVKYGPDYIFTKREIDNDCWLVAITDTLVQFGQEWDESKDMWRQQLDCGEYVCHYLHSNPANLEAGIAELA